jgi:hypothetical protein
VIFSGRALRKPESGQFVESSSQGTGHCLEHTGQSGAPLAVASLLCSKLENCSTVIFFVCVFELYAPEKNIK